MRKPVLTIVNGLPGAGKSTLARRLAADLRFPLFSRDSIYETLYDALASASNDAPPLLGSAAFALFYDVTGCVLAAGQPVIVEGFFGRPDLRRAEFLRLRRAHDFEPFEVLCKADGRVLLARFLTRAGSDERHGGHRDMEWLEHNKERLLQGRQTPLALGGQIVEIDTTTPDSFDYADILRRIQAVH